jgi:hypothetical protein
MKCAACGHENREEASGASRAGRAVPRRIQRGFFDSLMQRIARRWRGGSFDGCTMLIAGDRKLAESSGRIVFPYRSPQARKAGYRAFRWSLVARLWDAARPSIVRAFPDNASVGDPSNDEKPSRTPPRQRSPRSEQSPPP